MNLGIQQQRRIVLGGGSTVGTGVLVEREIEVGLIGIEQIGEVLFG